MTVYIYIYINIIKWKQQEQFFPSYTSIIRNNAKCLYHLDTARLVSQVKLKVCRWFHHSSGSCGLDGMALTCSFLNWWSCLVGRSRTYLKDWLISWGNSRDCHITMPLSLKTMEVQIKGDQWNTRFRTEQVYWSGSGGFETGFCSEAVAGKTVVCSVTCCSLKFSELFTSSMVDEAMPGKFM